MSIQLFGSGESDNFLKMYGLAFAHINFIEQWVGHLILIVKYPEFHTSYVPGSDEDLQKKLMPLVSKMENKTLGQKISELKEIEYEVNLISKLEELNQERKILAHTPSAEDERGDVYFFSLLSNNVGPVAHNFEKVIKLSEEIYSMIHEKLSDLQVG